MGRSSVASKAVELLAGGLMLVGLLVAAPALAKACKQDVNNAAAYLSDLQRNAHKARSSDRLRVLAFLKDAGVTLDSARKDCSAATNFGERALASTKVAAARASMAAADALIPDK